MGKKKRIKMLELHVENLYSLVDRLEGKYVGMLEELEEIDPSVTLQIVRPLPSGVAVDLEAGLHQCPHCDGLCARDSDPLHPCVECGANHHFEIEREQE